MICKMSRRDLRAEAIRLNAETISRANIYDYENERGKLCHDNGWSYHGYAYAEGTYGNIGRIDEICDSEGRTIKFVYWA